LCQAGPSFDYNDIACFSWENLLLRYLSGEVSSQEIGQAVRSRHFDLFSEFMEKYLETLRGEDFESLTSLLKKMGLPGYNLRRLTSRRKWHKLYAVFFLGLMRDKEAISELQKGLQDKDYLS